MRRTTGDHADVTKPTSLPSQIAWLSVCLLAAGWGTGLDPALGKLWQIWGLLGLASATGLDVAWRARRMCKKRTQQKSFQQRAVRNLTNLAAQAETSKKISVAVRHIIEDREQHSGAPLAGQRCDGRLPLQCTVQVTPLDDGPSTSEGINATAFSAYVRDISANGVGLMHNQTIDSRHVMLTFDLLDGKSIALVAHCQWQHVEADRRYSSGWKLVGVQTSLNSRSQEALQIA